MGAGVQSPRHLPTKSGKGIRKEPHTARKFRGISTSTLTREMVEMELAPKNSPKVVHIGLIAASPIPARVILLWSAPTSSAAHHPHAVASQCRLSGILAP